MAHPLVVRYDGYRFRLFSHDNLKPNSLAGNFVNDILPLQDGTIELIPPKNGGFSCQLKLPKVTPEQKNKKLYQTN